MTNTASTTTSPNPSEVGWQFVPQYYTFVNKQPNRLHCFYTKASTFIHGTEGEDGKPCLGQQEIHAKITSLGFQDCKVFIHSVDAQSSANGGIIIQVIGEMSNNGEPWKKFVQTFFLAEQPNGYFVLNDIFRFLKEETVDDEQASETEAVEEPAAPEPAVPASPVESTPPPAEPEPEPARAPTPPPPTFEEPVVEPEPEPEPQTNGVHAEVEEVEEQPNPEPVATASPPPVSPVAPDQPLAPSPAPPAQPVAAPAPVPAAPTPAAPQQPKTWANLAASNVTKWGPAVAQEARGVSEAPAASSSPAPSSGQQTPAPRARPPPPQGDATQAVTTVNTAQCFVKSVTENVPEALLRSTLTQRFGPIKELDIHRPKACAFLEFTSIEAARKAILASLPVPQGGEGGIRINIPEGGQARILVETRKERSERVPPRGPPVNGGPDNRRGNFRGGRGGPGGGRGRGAAPPQK
ncbi:hypothetical protein BXZ70DRAFT_1006269 [Cristinia sonorae]|uniref:G3BP-like protein n=1 Tax=Cristinia sonorae TaxID=1940300 RepID=A0A8K0USJ7_9AGAR|nr:hypothetical protein BXZ70DRAFT_1006269 [Cristinia sonorae]